MLLLYVARNSICTQKVLITLDEKKLDCELKPVNLFLNEQYRPEYLKLNPKGVVPTLVHDGRPVVESTLICEYLDETFPEQPLVPRDPYAKARMRIWPKLVDEGLFEAAREISFSAMFRERMKVMSPEQRETRFRNVGDPERRARYVSAFEKGVESAYVLQGIAHFEKAFARAEDVLAEHAGPWLVGTDYSLADVSLTPFVARLEYLDLLELWLEGRPRLQAWWARVKSRPSFARIGERLSPEEKSEMLAAGRGIRQRIGEKLAKYRASL